LGWYSLLRCATIAGMKSLFVLLALFVSTSLTKADLLIYRLSQTEHYVGGGLDFRVAVRGYFLIDLATFDISVVGAGRVFGQKLMVQSYFRAANIHSIAGAKGRPQTVISVLKDVVGDGARFNLNYARGVDAPVMYWPAAFAAWPKRMAVSGRSLLDDGVILQVNESSGSLSYMQRETVDFNLHGLTLEEATGVALEYFYELGYR